jgi:hypothetical protein
MAAAMIAFSCMPVWAGSEVAQPAAETSAAAVTQTASAAGGTNAGETTVGIATEPSTEAVSQPVTTAAAETGEETVTEPATAAATETAAATTAETAAPTTSAPATTEAAETSAVPKPVRAALQAESEAFWQDDFSDVITSTNGNVKKAWKNAQVPSGWNSIWIANAPASYSTTYWEVVSDSSYTGGKAIHLHSEDAKARLVIASSVQGLDYSKEYVLTLRVKKQNLSKLQARTQISDKGNIFLTSVDIPGGSTDDFVDVEMPLTDIQSVYDASTKDKTNNNGNLKIEIFSAVGTTGDVWIDSIRITEKAPAIHMNESSIFLLTSQTKTLTTDAQAGAELTWTSSDDSIAAVDGNGTVTAKSVGKAVITAALGEDNKAECKVTVLSAEQEAVFDSMRQRWTERLTGNSYWKGDSTGELVQSVVSRQDEETKAALDTFVRDDDKQLFTDLDLDFAAKKSSAGNSTKSDDSVAFSTAMGRIEAMAVSYSMKGSGYYQNADLKQDILYAMEWAYTHFYNETLDNQAMFGNWYHWWISIPKSLADTVILMHDEMSPELLEEEAAALAHFNEDPSYVYKVKGAAGKMNMTGANLADTSLVSLLRGVACSDPQAVTAGTATFPQIVSVVNAGEGIYADGSFIQHTNLAYTGGYGATLLNGVEKLIYITAGTDYSIDESETRVVYDWIWNGIRPLFADGAFFDMVNGRGVARSTSSDLKTGRGILQAVVLLTESAPADRKTDLQSFAKGQLLAGAQAMGRDTYYSGMNAAAMMASLSIADNPVIQADDNTGYAKVFGSMDKAVAHSEFFDFGISYASARTGRMEYGNQENSAGWHQSDGATYLYNGDSEQYSDNYWNTVDPQRLAGITTDHSTWTLKNWGNYTGNANFNGGAAVGPYMSVAMNFQNYASSDNPSLNAHKAWFVFDNEIVAMGSVRGIDASRTTETIVENKKVTGNNPLVVDGAEAVSTAGESASFDDAHWAWLAGNTDTDAVGYYFPGGSSLSVLRESRTGAYSDINGSAGTDSTPVTREYVSLAVPHGSNVNNSLSSYKKEYYSYVLLPGMTESDTKAYSESPDIEIICNSSMVQAVRDRKAGASGYLFWGDQNREIRVGEVAAVKGAVTIVKDEDTHTMTVGMCDVHQINSSLTFRVYGNGLQLIEADDGVSVTTDESGAKLVVNTSGAAGKTFTAKFSYRELTEEEEQALDSIRETFADGQTGNSMPDKNDEQYRAVMDQYMANAETALSHLNRDAGKGTNLFDDIDNQLDWTKGSSNTDGSSELTKLAGRIKDMALAYASEGCGGYYHSESLKNDILFCLSYLQTGFPSVYSYQDKVYANWWDWSIGVPKSLVTAGVLLYDDLSENERTQLSDLISLLAPDSGYCWMRGSDGRGYVYTATAANKTDLALINALNGLLGSDPTRLLNASATLDDSLKYVTSGEGFYEDGSYKQHGNFGYNGAYGVEMLRGVTQIASLTNNTPWASGADPDIIYEWILNAFRPLYADGGIFDMVQGRSVSRYNRSTITTGRYAMDAILTLAANAPEQYQDKILSFAKTQVKLGVAYDPDAYYGKLRFSSLIMAKKLLADDSIPEDNEIYTKIYGSMDKAVVHGDGFALGINMFSSRNGATESGNKENLKGWYTGDGMLTLAIGDQAQFDNGYWASVDPLRLNGITTNHVTQPLSGFSIKSNDRDWVGGASVTGSDYAAVGQDFKSNYSDLEAKKSWFVFGDQIVALGAGISTTEGDETETIVENRRLDADNTLLVNGNVTAAEEGEVQTEADWAWLSANTSGKATGYYFPDGSTIDVLRETRTGKWSDINGNTYPKDESNEVTGTYLSLALPHGTNVQDGTYSYVLLPGKSDKEMESYAKENGIRILVNTSDVQAAADLTSGTVGINFWKAGTVEIPEEFGLTSVSSDAPAAVVIWNESGVLHIAVSDPTQKQSEITLSITGEDVQPLENAETSGATVNAAEDGITVAASVEGLNGASVETSAAAGKKQEETETPTETPTEKPTETPTEKPTEKPTETPTEKPSETTTEKPTEKPTEAPSETTTANETGKPSETPTGESSETGTNESKQTQTEQPEGSMEEGSKTETAAESTKQSDTGDAEKSVVQPSVSQPSQAADGGESGSFIPTEPADTVSTPADDASGSAPAENTAGTAASESDAETVAESQTAAEAVTAQDNDIEIAAAGSGSGSSTTTSAGSGKEGTQTQSETGEYRTLTVSHGTGILFIILLVAGVWLVLLILLWLRRRKDEKDQ